MAWSSVPAPSMKCRTAWHPCAARPRLPTFHILRRSSGAGRFTVKPSRFQSRALERLETVKPVFPLGEKFWALTPEERTALVQLFEQEPVRAMVTRLQCRESSDAVTMVDAAYWIKGCSSLGRLRYAVMLRVGEGKGSALCLVDMKESVAAAAPRAEG